jgi:hypothetical protein
MLENSALHRPIWKGSVIRSPRGFNGLQPIPCSSQNKEFFLLEQGIFAETGNRRRLFAIAVRTVAAAASATQIDRA